MALDCGQWGNGKQPQPPPMLCSMWLDLGFLEYLLERLWNTCPGEVALHFRLLCISIYDGPACVLPPTKSPTQRSNDYPPRLVRPSAATSVFAFRLLNARGSQ